MDTKTQIYNKIKNKISHLEEQRKKAINYKKKIPLMILGMIAAICVCGALEIGLGFGENKFSITGLFAFFVILYGADIMAKYNDYKAIVKHEAIPVILNAVNPTFKYLSYKGITREDVDVAGFKTISKVDKFSVEDSMVGEWNGRNFTFGEIYARNEYLDSEGRVETKIIFKGQYIKVDFHKRTTGITILGTDKSLWKDTGLKSIKLEDAEFNKMFSISSTNEIEARYLLTPAFMEKIKELKCKYKCRELNISFSENSIYLLVDQNKNLFEIDIKTSFTEPKFIKSFLDEFTLINDICETLDLHK